MAWANQRVFAAVQDLPDEALGAYLTNPAFTAARILQHLVEGAEWFAFCSCQNPWRPRIRPTTMEDVATLASELAELDALLIGESAREDELLTIEDEHGSRQNRLSTILSQAVHHGTEHRAQLVDALDLRGYSGINLDDLDLWVFEAHENNAR